MRNSTSRHCILVSSRGSEDSCIVMPSYREVVGRFLFNYYELAYVYAGRRAQVTNEYWRDVATYQDRVWSEEDVGWFAPHQWQEATTPFDRADRDSALSD